MRISRVFGTVVVAGVALAATTIPASADLVTRCVGMGGAVTVPGDLVVPAGASCTLVGTTVTGKVRVNAGADLVVSDVTFDGAVTVARDAYFDATTSVISGAITSRGFGVYVDRSVVGEDVRGRAASDSSSFTYVYQSTVDGQVDVRAGEVLVDSSNVAGPVRGRGTTWVDVKNSTLLSELLVRGNAEGVIVCASEVDGDATFTGNAGVQIGQGDLLSSCDDGVNYFGGNVTAANNTVGVTVSGNIVRGNLTGSGNDPAPLATENRVRGEISGQFAEVGAEPQARARMMAVPFDRTEEARQLIQERRASAMDQATAAGPALL